ncbi:MAG: hypothetical protein JNM72_19680 [Deltaproteobacteria bacterium]|nr:hypothetical protein [Deltaproteobacteria bacterium]
MSLAALSLLSGLAFASPAAVPCAGPAFLPPGGLPRPTFIPPAPPTGTKSERDARGVVANRFATDNFVIRWGPSGGVSGAEVERLAAAFEDAWDEEVLLQGHPVPVGSDTFRFNVYIGDSGGGTPPGYGTGGYFDVDSEGYPQIVVSAATLDTPDFADITAAHEFYHAIQGATERYPYSGTGAWYWEATATWASGTVYPENPYYAVFLFGYVLFPHLPLNFYEPYAEGDLTEYYQYGAFIWPWYLTEVAADRRLIQESWTDTGTETDPLEVLRDRLADRGLDMDALWLDHLAANVSWDYLDPAALALGTDGYPSIPEWDNVIAAEVGAEGTAGWVSGPSALEPYRYGNNAITVETGLHPRMRVELLGGAAGDRSSPATWGGRVVVTRGDAQEVLPLVMADATTGVIELDDLDTADGLTVLIGVTAPANRTWDRERFRYNYRIQPITGADDGAGDDGSADGTTDDGGADEGSDSAGDEGGGDGAADGGDGGVDSGGGGAPTDGGSEAGAVDETDDAAAEDEPVKLDPPGCAAAPRATMTWGLLGLGALFARRRRR